MGAGGPCPGRSLSRRSLSRVVCVHEVSVQQGLVGPLSRGVSVHRESLSRGSLSSGGLCPEGVCPRRVSVRDACENITLRQTSFVGGKKRKCR